MSKRDQLAHRFCETVKPGEDAHMIAFQMGWDAAMKHVLGGLGVTIERKLATYQNVYPDDKELRSIRETLFGPDRERSVTRVACKGDE
jgi:hypothetical protein